MRISVIEDNPALLTMVELALRMHGHIVETYTTISAFIAVLQRNERTSPCDLIIVDLFLDRQLGTEIVETLRARRAKMIPTILISAAEEGSFLPIRKQYPNLPILQKPFRIQTLISLINETAVKERIA